MAGTIKLTRAEWQPISTRLSEECPKSWTTITYVQKRELGFTVRHHVDYNANQWADRKEYVCLDFYDDVKETYFRMKYL